MSKEQTKATQHETYNDPKLPKMKPKLSKNKSKPPKRTPKLMQNDSK